MIKKIIGILFLVLIVIMVSGCSNDNHSDTKNPISDNKPRIMSDPIRDDSLKRFNFTSNQIHYKLCGKDHSADIKWTYTDKGLEAFKKYDCGFGIVITYDINGTPVNQFYGFRK